MKSLEWPCRRAIATTSVCLVLAALVVLALQERASRYHLSRVSTRAASNGASYVLNGAKSVVPAGDEADAFIVPARMTGADNDRNGIGLFLVEKGDAQVKGYPTQDGARTAELVLRGCPGTLITTDGYGVLEYAVDVGIAALCAEGTGLMDKLTRLTAEYMNTRKQFGVALSTFQVIRHRMADVKMQLELGRSMSYFATLTLGRVPEQRRRAISQARVQLGQSMRFVGQQCVQLHGGIGVTDEYLGSHYFKRLTMLEMQFGGDSMHHLGEVNARMLDTAGVFA
jgi:alkylation response protein AidB-like acyl-CoA dehydrogenase